MIANCNDEIPQSTAASFVEEDDEETAINRALDELEAGKGRPLAEFAEELSARFAARYEI